MKPKEYKVTIVRIEPHPRGEPMEMPIYMQKYIELSDNKAVDFARTHIARVGEYEEEA